MHTSPRAPVRQSPSLALALIMCCEFVRSTLQGGAGTGPAWTPYFLFIRI
jgi:hypothetical protein